MKTYAFTQVCQPHVKGKKPPVNCVSALYAEKCAFYVRQRRVVMKGIKVNICYLLSYVKILHIIKGPFQALINLTR